MCLWVQSMFVKFNLSNCWGYSFTHVKITATWSTQQLRGFGSFVYYLTVSKVAGCVYVSLPHFQFEEVVQYVVDNYPRCPVEDLKGDESLLVALSTHLAVKVVQTHCSGRFSLKDVPKLMKQDICPHKVGRLHSCGQRGTPTLCTLHLLLT